MIGAALATQGSDGRTAIVTSTTLQTIAAVAAVHEGAQRIHQWLVARHGPPLADSGAVTVFGLRENR